MVTAALSLIVAGVVITACALAPSSFDFAIAVRKRWHVTIFPPPLIVGVLTVLIGVVTLIAFLLRR
jgi:hypothetical protein